MKQERALYGFEKIENNAQHQFATMEGNIFFKNTSLN